jgi:hypothetical protein
MTTTRIPVTQQFRRSRQGSLRVHIWNRKAFEWNREVLPASPGEDLVDRTGGGYPTPRRYDEQEDEGGEKKT